MSKTRYIKGYFEKRLEILNNKVQLNVYQIYMTPHHK